MGVDAVKYSNTCEIEGLIYVIWYQKFLFHSTEENNEILLTLGNI